MNSKDIGATPPTQVSQSLGRWITVSAIICAAVIGLGMFAISFSALRDLAIRSGISSSLGWVWAVCIDGIIAASTLSLVALAKHPTRAKILPWLLIISGGAVSVAGNIFDAQLHAEPGFATVMVIMISAAPPLGLLALTQLVVILSRRTSTIRSHLSSTTTAGPIMDETAIPYGPENASFSHDVGSSGNAHTQVEHSESEKQFSATPSRAKSAEHDRYKAARKWALKKLTYGKDPTGTEVADRFGCSPSTARRWLRKIREEHQYSADEHPDDINRLRAVGS